MRAVSVSAALAVVIATGPAWSQSALSRAVSEAENMQPAIPRAEQQAEAADRLAAFEERTGQKPNILFFIVDDMGYGDPGAFGGGEAIGPRRRTWTVWRRTG